MPPKDSKKACCLVRKHKQQSEPSPSDLQSHGDDPLVHREELQYSGAQPGTCEYPHTRLEPHTLGNSGKVEGPAPLKEFGSKNGAEPNHI